jgi:hypothetical protein
MKPELEKGQRVTVDTFGGAKAEKIVVEDLGETVLICRPEEFEAAKAQNRAPISIAFRKEYVHVQHAETVA